MTTATSQLQQQLHDELLPLYGRPLADSSVLDFLTRHGFKVPKTLHKSARAEGQEWLCHKKAHVDLLLATQPYNPLFPPLPAERKGMLMPRLACAVFTGRHIALPAGLDWGASIKEAGHLLGTPWWPRNGMDQRMWRAPVPGQPHVNTMLAVHLTQAGVCAPWVGIDVNVPALELGLHGGPLFKLAESPDLYPRLMLMAWQLHQLGHVPESTSAADSLAILTQTMHDLGRSYLLREDLAQLAQFDWGYGLMNAVMPHSLRDDYQRIVDGDELPTDAQLAELHHTFAQRLAEFEASGWSDSSPSPT